MNEFLENLQLERVSGNDEEKVLAIRNPEDISEGTDYLPSCFRRLLSCPNSTGYAVCYKGEWIAFTLVSIIDDGETAVFRSGRISKKYENHGIVKWIIAKLIEILKKTTKVRYIESGTTREDEKAKRRHQEGKCYTVAHREMTDFINITVEQTLQTWANYIAPSTISIVDADMLSNIFDRKDWTDRIFGKRVLVNYVSFRPLKSNITYIFQEITAVFGSNLHDVNQLLITFENHYEATAGKVFIIDVYGNVTENLHTHIEQHIKHAAKPENRRNMIVRLLYDIEMNADFMGKVMNSFCFVKRRLKKPATSIWVLESKCEQ